MRGGNNLRLFSVKKLGKNGMWGTVSLIDENGSFRGEAKFETKKEAEEYLKKFRGRMKKPVELMVVDESPQPEPKIKEKKKH
jgi:hypothetical protein